MSHGPIIRIFLSIWLLAPVSQVLAQSAPLPVDEAFAFSAARTPSGGVELQWDVAGGYYLYRDRMTAETADGLALDLTTPEGELKDDPNFGRMEVYHQHATASIAPSTIASLEGSALLLVTYQGCQEGGICYRPETRTVDLAALSFGGSNAAGDSKALADFVGGGVWKRSSSSVEDGGAPISTGTLAAVGANSAQASTTTVSNLPEPGPVGSGIETDPAAGNLIAGLLAGGGAAWVIVAFFALGLGLAFTPCVFPMYPILAGQLSRAGERLSPGRGFLLSSTYVSAMAAAFGLLGVSAAWSGQNLQMVLQSEITIAVVSGIFALLALSMFGLFELRLPTVWTNALGRLGTGPRRSLTSSAALGFTSALIVGPCVTAPLAGGLIYIAQTGDVGLGAAALFALGLGQGVPLIVFGTIGAKALPKAGLWMTTVTRAFGLVFLALAIWMLSRILPASVTLCLWSAFLIGGGVFLGALDVLGREAGVRQRLAKATGPGALLYGAILAVGAAAGANDPLRPLTVLTVVGNAAAPQAVAFRTLEDPGKLQNLLRESDRPSLLYFTADWCVTCDVIERDVFGNPVVRAELADLQLLKLDVTESDPARTALMSELGVAGPPTMLFVDTDAREVAGSRLIGDISAQAFLDAARLAEGR